MPRIETMFKNKLAQSSVEYLFVVALALMIIIPGSMIFYNYSQNSQEQLLHSQIFKLGNTMLDSATMMYSVGDNSWKTIKLSFPKEVASVKVFNVSGYSELVINYGRKDMSDTVFFSDIPLCNATECNCTTGCQIDVNSGLNKMRVMSKNGDVYFKVVQ